MKNDQNISVEALRNFPTFSELTRNQLEQIISICKVHTYKKNETIFYDGDNYKGFYILLNGSIKIYKLSYDGKELILHLIKPSESFADVPLFEGGGYPVNAQAIADSVLVFVHKKSSFNL